MRNASRQPIPAAVLGLVLFVTFAWGVNWPLLKIVLGEMAPLHFRTWCMWGGAAGLFALAAWNRQPVRVPAGQWGRLVLIAAFNITCWSVLVAYGVPLMESGRASILAFTMPIWSVPLSRWLLNEPVTARRLAGLLLGIAGMGLLVGSELHAAGRSPLGAMLMLGAAATWALGVVMIRRWQFPLPATSFTAWQLLIGGVPIVIGSLFERGSYSPLGLSAGAVFALYYNVFVCFIFSYWAWTKVATVVPVAISSLTTLIVPVVGVFSGMIVLGERPHWTDFAALALVVTALAVVLLPQRQQAASLKFPAA